MGSIRRVLLPILVLTSLLPLHVPSVRAASQTTITFSVVGGGTNGTIGLDAVFGTSGGGGAYDRMVRWDADNRLWNYDQVLGSPTYGWRTTATSSLTVPGAASVMRLELYPHPTTTCSGTNENDACYWLTYDPWTGTSGGTHVQVEPSMGSDWLDVGTIRFPTIGDGVAFRADGAIVSSSPVAEGRVEIDFFQIDCGWHQVCQHPLTNEKGRALGAFGTSKSKGARWTAGVVWPGQYLINVRDTARDIHLQGIVQIGRGNIPTIDLDSPCFGLDDCVSQQGSVPAVAGGFHPTTPTRILDTRKGWGIANGMLRFGDGSQSSTNPLLRADDTANHDLRVLGVGGVPESGVSAVLLNVTAIEPATNGFLTIGPRPPGRGDVLDDQNSYGAWPDASNLNVRAGQTAPNLVLARVGAGGRIRLYNYGYPLHMVADVAGWFDTGSTVTNTGGLGFFGVTPTRILDTRNGIGGVAGANRFEAGNDRAIAIRGVAGIPSNAESVVINITAVGPTGTGYVTAYPSGSSVPDASNLNFVAGQTVPNAVIAPVSAQGKVCFYVYGKAHLIADVNGWFTAGGSFTKVTPQRIADTRSGIGVARARVGALNGGGTPLEVPVLNVAGVPATGVDAVSINVTATGTRANAYGGYVTVYPCGAAPEASTLNFTTGQTVPNAAIARVSANGTVCILVYGETDVIVDVNGWFGASRGFTGMTPVRVSDTRNGLGSVPGK